ncbi:MAG: alpha/beta hydrolase [Clostridium sp.]
MECNIKDITINYKIVGEGKPMVMLHGYSIDHRVLSGCMEPILCEIDGFKRIYFDLPGMGNSTTSDSVTNSDVMLDIVIEFINMVIPNDNFLIAAESYGGYLARGLVYKMASRVDGILMICPVIIAERDKRNIPEQIMIKKDEEILMTLSPEEAKDFNSSIILQNKKTFNRYNKEVKPGLDIANKEFIHKFQTTGYAYSFDVDKINIQFDKPTLILLGRQDSVVGFKDALSIIDNYSRGTFAILDNSGHNLQIEQEDQFKCLVKEWINRID